MSMTDEYSFKSLAWRGTIPPPTAPLLMTQSNRPYLHERRQSFPSLCKIIIYWSTWWSLEVVRSSDLLSPHVGLKFLYRCRITQIACYALYLPRAARIKMESFSNVQGYNSSTSASETFHNSPPDTYENRVCQLLPISEFFFYLRPAAPVTAHILPCRSWCIFYWGWSLWSRRDAYIC